jgi:hypothetical protein
MLMVEDFKGLYNIRESKEEDKNFILATFLRGLYHGDSFFSRIPKNIFMNNYKRVAQGLVDNSNVTIRVACLKEDPDIVLGYSILSKNELTIYWVFVKKVWRLRGIARSLVPENPIAVAHLTKVGDSLLHKLKTKVIFNPFF